MTYTPKSIAQKIGVHPSTITREVRRNANRDNQYVFCVAQEKCQKRKHSTLPNHRKDDLLWWRIEQMIIDNYVYKNKERLSQYLPHKLCYRRREKKQHRPTKATNIPNRTSIHERPAEANGKRFGDWEMDLIVDSCQRVILTLVERSTNFLMMEKIKTGKKSEPIAKTVVRSLMPYRKTVKTITTDNGSEFASHQLITKGLHMKGKDDVIVYFADAYSSWQKGCVENTNKLIRRYIPKNDFRFQVFPTCRDKQVSSG